eukprot:TRINITY_DN2194_c0_g1_i1.p1 TRINITY_DN2194_c0_g1~~TRINITY_DN2194_c0_g1_i1.p1  ORF type:complete len:374 (+),score=130.49 TRINITY_DN2194_c0_g1_i1:70-1191(+)
MEDEKKLEDDALDKLLAQKSVHASGIRQQAGKFKNGIKELLVEEGKADAQIGWCVMDQEGKVIFSDNFNNPSYEKIAAAKARVVVNDGGSTQRVEFPEALNLGVLFKVIKVMAGGKELPLAGSVVVRFYENREEKFAVFSVGGYGTPQEDDGFARKLLAKLGFGKREPDAKHEEGFYVPPFANPDNMDATELDQAVDAELGAILSRQSVYGVKLASLQDSFKTTISDFYKEEKKDPAVAWVLMDHEGAIIMKDSLGAEGLQKIAAAKARVVVNDGGSLKRLENPASLNLKTLVKIVKVMVGGKELPIAGAVVIRYKEKGEETYAAFAISGYGDPNQDFMFAERVLMALGFTRQEADEKFPEPYWAPPPALEIK